MTYPAGIEDLFFLLRSSNGLAKLANMTNCWFLYVTCRLFHIDENIQLTEQVCVAHVPPLVMNVMGGEEAIRIRIERWDETGP